MFKRKDGEPSGEKWLIAEYYDSLGDLSAEGLSELTRALKEKCTFFPSIAECLAITRPSRWDYSSTFRLGGMFRKGEVKFLPGDCVHKIEDQS